MDDGAGPQLFSPDLERPRPIHCFQESRPLARVPFLTLSAANGGTCRISSHLLFLFQDI